jgi:hypothetical protein
MSIVKWGISPWEAMKLIESNPHTNNYFSLEVGKQSGFLRFFLPPKPPVNRKPLIILTPVEDSVINNNNN